MIFVKHMPFAAEKAWFNVFFRDTAIVNRKRQKNG